MSGAIRKRNHEQNVPHASIVGAILILLALLVVLGHFSPAR